MGSVKLTLNMNNTGSFQECCAAMHMNLPQEFEFHFALKLLQQTKFDGQTLFGFRLNVTEGFAVFRGSNIYKLVRRTILVAISYSTPQ